MHSHFFWSGEHASDWGYQVIGAYPTLAQATAITDISQSALFSFPRDPNDHTERNHE